MIARVLAWYTHTLYNWKKEFPIPETESTVRHTASAELPSDIEPLTFADPDTSLAWFDIERANLTACVRVAVEYAMPGGRVGSRRCASQRQVSGEGEAAAQLT